MSGIKILRYLLKRKIIATEDFSTVATIVRERKLPLYHNQSLSQDYLDLLQTTDDYRVS